MISYNTVFDIWRNINHTDSRPNRPIYGRVARPFLDYESGFPLGERSNSLGFINHKGFVSFDREGCRISNIGRFIFPFFCIELINLNKDVSVQDNA